MLDKGLAILLHGESGSGKEAFAKAMHEASARRAQPFVAVNCAAIPETLIESELFGYREGSPARGRRAWQDRAGAWRHAVPRRDRRHAAGHADAALRVLAEREVMPLGSEQSIPVDVQLICATHRDLREMVAQGQFRLDLYYRLNSVTLELPLRDRADKNALIDSLLREDGRQLYGRAVAITAAARDLLLRHDWPGNIRQLKNAAHGHGTQGASPSVPSTCRRNPWRPVACAAPERMLSLGSMQEVMVAQVHDERTALLQALKTHHWNVTEAARSLGLSRATVYRHMQKWEIVSPNRLGD